VLAADKAPKAEKALEVQPKAGTPAAAPTLPPGITRSMVASGHDDHVYYEGVDEEEDYTQRQHIRAEEALPEKAEKDKEAWEKERDARLTIPYHVPKLIKPDIKNAETVLDEKQKEADKAVAHKEMVEAAHKLAKDKGHIWPLTQVRVHKEKVGEMIVRHNIGLGRVDDQLDKVQDQLDGMQKAKDAQERKEKQLKKLLAKLKEIKDEEAAWAKMKKDAMANAKAAESAKEERAEAAEKAVEEKIKKEKAEADKLKEEAEGPAENERKAEAKPTQEARWESDVVRLDEMS